MGTNTPTSPNPRPILRRPRLAISHALLLLTFPFAVLFMPNHTNALIVGYASAWTAIYLAL